jgi:hypothetical protein
MREISRSDSSLKEATQERNMFACISGLMLVLCFMAPGSANAQDALSTLLLKTNVAFSPSGKMPSTVTLKGTVEWTAGSTHESGDLQLKIAADGSTSEAWSLPTQSYSILQGALATGRACKYTDSANKEHTLRDLNCHRAVPWFSPWMGAQLNKSGLATAVDITDSSDSSSGLERVKFTSNMAAGDVSAATADGAQLQSATSVSITYAVATGLPEAIEYDQVFDSEASHSLKTRVVFSDYRSEAGFMVPHHLQRYIQRTLQADILVTSFTIE